jgi:biofilm protein TabA
MALFGSLGTVEKQLVTSAAFARALAYVKEALAPGSVAHTRILAVPLGATERVELGEGVFALEQAYTAKPRGDGKWEAHVEHIDVQVIVTGEELMEVTEVSRLTVAEDFTPAKDLLFYKTYDEGSVLRVRAGEVAVFFPEDGHKPSLAVNATPGVVRKTVVKVPVARV